MFGEKETGKKTAEKKDKDATATHLLTVSGDFAKIEGTFEIAESLDVECEIGGELNVRGRLTIGENGVVNANVRTVDAVIRGTYEGNMIATGNVQIATTGRVSGNITTDSLVISKGGFFNGSVAHIKDEDRDADAPRLRVEGDDRKRDAAKPDATKADATKADAPGSAAGQTGEPRKTGPGKVDIERIVHDSRNV